MLISIVSNLNVLYLGRSEPLYWGEQTVKADYKAAVASLEATKDLLEKSRSNEAAALSQKQQVCSSLFHFFPFDTAHIFGVLTHTASHAWSPLQNEHGG